MDNDQDKTESRQATKAFLIMCAFLVVMLVSIVGACYYLNKMTEPKEPAKEIKGKGI